MMAQRSRKNKMRCLCSRCFKLEIVKLIEDSKTTDRSEKLGTTR